MSIFLPLHIPKNYMTQDEITKKALEGLFKGEEELFKIDKKIEILRHIEFTKLFKFRQEFVNSLPNFWFETLSQHPDFSDFFNPQEFKFFKYLKDIRIQYDLVEKINVFNYSLDNLTDPDNEFKNFHLIFEFESDNEEILKSQTIIKKFYYKFIDNAIDQLYSDPVYIEWPKELKNLNAYQKKRSFFSFFSWDGDSKSRIPKESKDSKSQKMNNNETTLLDIEELVDLLVDDIIPNAVKYYVMSKENKLEKELSSIPKMPENEDELNVEDDEYDNANDKIEDEGQDNEVEEDDYDENSGEEVEEDTIEEDKVENNILEVDDVDGIVVDTDVKEDFEEYVKEGIKKDS